MIDNLSFALYLTGEEPPKSELWKDEDGDLDSISDAGSIDSIASDHVIPPLDNPLSCLAQTARAQLDEGKGLKL